MRIDGKADQIYIEILDKIKKGTVKKEVPLKDYTSFKVGGNAAIMAVPGDAEELGAVLKLVTDQEIPYFVMGNGTDLLVKDAGYDGVVIRIADGFSEVEITGNILKAGAGALMSVAANRALECSLKGLAFASGIPGSVGGGAFMNAGAYGGELSQVISAVTAVTVEGKVQRFEKEELKFGYRHSVFQENGAVIACVEMELEHGDREEIAAEMQELARRRREKQPLALPSAGSFFKRPTGYFAGGLIESAGLKGLSLGGARVSPMHAGFIVNENNATAEDILNLMEVVQHTVYDQSGIRLEPEVRIIG